MVFEWDENKNNANVEKHGIDFADAEIIFEELIVAKRDNCMEYGESRWLGLGNLNGIIVVVAYTYRGENIRIISIRKANEHEEKTYRKQVSKK